MARRRLSIARLMAIVVIVGLDCGLVRLFLATGEGLRGGLVLGLALSVGMIGMLIGRGGVRRFAVGFTAAGFAAPFGVVAALMLVSMLVPSAPSMDFIYLNAVLHRIPAWLDPPDAWVVRSGGIVTRPSMLLLLVIEVAESAPLIVLALAGGVLALLTRRPSIGPDPAPVIS